MSWLIRNNVIKARHDQDIFFYYCSPEEAVKKSASWHVRVTSVLRFKRSAEVRIESCLPEKQEHTVEGGVWNIPFQNLMLMKDSLHLTNPTHCIQNISCHDVGVGLSSYWPICRKCISHVNTADPTKTHGVSPAIRQWHLQAADLTNLSCKSHLQTATSKGPSLPPYLIIYLLMYHSLHK